jgi:hypothetical protein
MRLSCIVCHSRLRCRHLYEQTLTCDAVSSNNVPPQVQLVLYALLRRSSTQLRLWCDSYCTLLAMCLLLVRRSSMCSVVHAYSNAQLTWLLYYALNLAADLFQLRTQLIYSDMYALIT